MIIDINEYQPQSNDKFIFDTNIWLLIHCPLGNYRQDKVKKYSTFYRKIRDAGCEIFYSSMVLSEFINRYLRMDFNQKKRRDQNIDVHKSLATFFPMWKRS